MKNVFRRRQSPSSYLYNLTSPSIVKFTTNPFSETFASTIALITFRTERIRGQNIHRLSIQMIVFVVPLIKYMFMFSTERRPGDCRHYHYETTGTRRGFHQSVYEFR